jgi:hypothetical protein
VHLVASGAKDYQVGDAIIGPLAINVADLQNVANSKTAVNANAFVMLKGEPSIIYAFHGRPCESHSAVKRSCHVYFDEAYRQSIRGALFFGNSGAIPRSRG